MCQEKKEEEESPASRTASILKDYIKKSKKSLITAASDNIGKIRLDRKTIKTRKQKRREMYGDFN